MLETLKKFTELINHLSKIDNDHNHNSRNNNNNVFNDIS